MPEQNEVTFKMQLTSDEDMLSNTQTKLAYTTEKDDIAGDQQPRDQGDEVTRLHLQSSAARNRMQDAFADNLKASESWSPWNWYRSSQKLIRWMSFSAHMSKAS